MKKFTLYDINGKPFYNKCYVEVDGNVATLYSYGKKIMSYNTLTREVKVTDDYNYSKTTKRHQKSFCEFYDIDKVIIGC